MSTTVTIELSDAEREAIQRQDASIERAVVERLRSALRSGAGQANGTVRLPPAPDDNSLWARIERKYPGVLGPPDTRTEEEKEKARQAFRQCIGSVRSGDPHGSDNERIDADLAREYANNHDND